jgi:hypothetical protein
MSYAPQLFAQPQPKSMHTILKFRPVYSWHIIRPPAHQSSSECKNQGSKIRTNTRHCVLKQLFQGAYCVFTSACGPYYHFITFSHENPHNMLCGLNVFGTTCFETFFFFWGFFWTVTESNINHHIHSNSLALCMRNFQVLARKHQFPDRFIHEVAARP